MAAKPVPSGGAERVKARRHAARQAAVQALYQVEADRATPARVVHEFLAHRVGLDPEDGGVPDMDPALFEELVLGTSKEVADIDDMLVGALSEGWTLERLDSVLRALLRAAVFELAYRAGTPPRVAISEYLSLCDAFFEGREANFANGILHHIAQAMRPEELGE